MNPITLNRSWMIAALVGGTAALGLAIAPLAAQVETPPEAAPTWEGCRGDRMEALNITPEQEAQFQAIRRDTRAQIANVLTEDQRQAFQEGVEAGEPFPMVMQSLNLTDDQHEQIHTIMQTSMEQRRNVLTEEQRAQMQEFGGGRGMRGGHGFGDGHRGPGQGWGGGRGMQPGGGI